MTLLEDKVEKYFIALLQTNSVLAGKSIKAFDADEPADAPGIVVEAVQKNRRLDGPKGFDVDVRVLYRSTTDDVATINEVSDSIISTVYGAAPGAVAEESNFTYLLILDEMSGERRNSKDLRERERIFPIIARIDE